MNASGTAVDKEAVDHKNLFYPPGGILLWIIILLELLTFGIALIIMAYSYQGEKEIFHQSAQKLNILFGSINTVVLLTSGYLMALSVQAFKANKTGRSRQLLWMTLTLGLVFIIIKSFEYHHKIAQGLTLGVNTFFDFYWLLTGFHLVHVIVGMVILLWLSATGKNKPHHQAVLDFESGAAFWHLCDLIWLLLFPALYLIF